MKTDNEIIAEFMGFKLIESAKHRNCYEHDDLMGEGAQQFKYDTSWDWLMPVVEKIYSKAFPFEDKFMDIAALPLGTPIKEVYETIVKFIHWYNAQIDKS